MPDDKMLVKVNERIDLIIGDCKRKGNYNQDLEELNNNDIKAMYGF
jgi:hypothetical protein